MIREIVHIDEDLCNGCGLCVPGCHEGALRIIDGKARLISDLLCDGLGACIGHCPEGAITIEKREAEAYNEVLALKEMITKGRNTVIAHLQHLKDHNETAYLQEGLDFLLQQDPSMLGFDPDEVKAAVLKVDLQSQHQPPVGCPGSAARNFAADQPSKEDQHLGPIGSELTHWPVQMHLINPMAGHFKRSDLVLAADCVAFSLGSFHRDYLKGKTLAIACPKLDQGIDTYISKMIGLIDGAVINTITVVKMEVPCCGGLLQIVKAALQQTERKVPVKSVTISIDGRILEETWM